MKYSSCADRIFPSFALRATGEVYPACSRSPTGCDLGRLTTISSSTTSMRRRSDLEFIVVQSQSSFLGVKLSGGYDLSPKARFAASQARGKTDFSSAPTSCILGRQLG